MCCHSEHPGPSLLGTLVKGQRSQSRACSSLNRGKEKERGSSSLPQSPTLGQPIASLPKQGGFTQRPALEVALVHNPVQLCVFEGTLALVGGPAHNPKTRPSKNVSLHLSSCPAFIYLADPDLAPHPRTSAFFGNGTPGMACAWLWLWPCLVDEPFVAVPGVAGGVPSAR